MPVLALYEGVCKVVQAKEGGEAGDESDGDGDDAAEADVWFPAKIVGRAAKGAKGSDSFVCEWEDGKERFVATCFELRTFLSHTPLKSACYAPAPAVGCCCVACMHAF